MEENSVPPAADIVTQSNLIKTEPQANGECKLQFLVGKKKGVDTSDLVITGGECSDGEVKAVKGDRKGSASEAIRGRGGTRGGGGSGGKRRKIRGVFRFDGWNCYIFLYFPSVSHYVQLFYSRYHLLFLAVNHENHQPFHHGLIFKLFRGVQ